MLGFFITALTRGIKNQKPAIFPSRIFKTICPHFSLLTRNYRLTLLHFLQNRIKVLSKIKALQMKNKSTNLEILLISNASFFQRDWSELNTNKNDKQLSQKEKLIHLCWNGMLKEMIPEIVQTEVGKKPLTLWEINQSGNMLDLRYGDIDREMNDEWSINPYVYLTFACVN